jgi:hypothetical protein
MIDTNFDPTKMVEAWRNAFAPVLKTQQESLKALDRLSRYHYAVVGDYLEYGLAHAKAAVSAQTPSEFVSKQVELTNGLSDKIRARAQEFVNLATEAQTGFSDLVADATAKVADVTKRKAA